VKPEVKTLVLLNDEIQHDFSLGQVALKDALIIEKESEYKIIHVVTQALQYRSEIKLAEHARYEHWLINLSPEQVNYQLTVDLEGKGARAELRGIVLGQKKAELRHQVRMNHRADYTATDIVVYGIGDEQSKVAFDGIIYVKEKTKGVDAHELLKNLLLSNQAEIAVKPILEIYSHEVACTHGASIGDLDEDALFYLQSRGFTMDEAKAILLKSFATQFLPELDHAPLQAWIENMILAQLKTRGLT
jgi:Fe-S cluster assembly protein SufD